MENITETNHLLNEVRDLAIDNSISKDLYNNQIMGELDAVFSDSFNYNINSRKYTTVGATAVASSQAYVSSTAVPATTGSIITKQKLIFEPGLTAIARFVGRFGTPILGTSRQFMGLGISGLSEAIGFGYEEDIFGIFTVYEATTYFTPYYRFSDNKVMPNLQFLNCFHIEFTSGHASFYINRVLVHHINKKGSSFTGILSIFNLPFQIYVNNGLLASDLKVHCSEYSTFVSGHSTVKGVFNSVYNSTTTSTTSQNIINIRVVSTYATKINNRQVFPKILSIAGIGASNKFIIFRLIKNPTLVGVVYTSVDTTAKCITEVDTAGVFTVGTGQVVFTTLIFSGASQEIDISKLDIILEAGDVLMCSSATTLGTGDSGVALTFLENI